MRRRSFYLLSSRVISSTFSSTCSLSLHTSKTQVHAAAYDHFTSLKIFSCSVSLVHLATSITSRLIATTARTAAVDLISSYTDHGCPLERKILAAGLSHRPSADFLNIQKLKRAGTHRVEGVLYTTSFLGLCEVHQRLLLELVHEESPLMRTKRRS